MQDPYSDFREVYFAICKATNTPYSLSCWLRFKDKVSFLDLEQPDPNNYNSAHDFERDYLVFAYASKMRGVNLDGRDLRQVALASFTADEAFNLLTEARLRNLASVPSGADFECMIHYAQRKIAKVLGPFSAEKVLRGCFGAGASALLPRRNSRPDQKYVTRPSVTAECVDLAMILIGTSPTWRLALDIPDGPVDLRNYLALVKGNTFDTVPKSVKTDRTIAKEPVINGYLQQGVHRYIRQRLSKFGVDLRDQSVNKLRAQLAYRDGLSTIDLTSASNSVTRQLVWLLLPFEWASYLDRIRSKRTRLPDGTWHENAMFSSMGNAFTFELETLIFWAVSSQFGEATVYGDDIVVTRDGYDAVVRSLEFLGFRINKSKSFKEGNFFESCGGHYFRGIDVTPVYQKASPLLLIEERIRAHNRLYRWLMRVYPACDPMTSYLSGVLAHLARGVDLIGPPLKDGDPFIFTHGTNYVAKNRHSVAIHRCLVPRHPRRRSVSRGALAWWLDSNADLDRSLGYDPDDLLLLLNREGLSHIVSEVGAEGHLETSLYYDKAEYVVRWKSIHDWRYC